MNTMTETEATRDWKIYRGSRIPHDEDFPEPPPWRTFNGEIINLPPLDIKDDSYMLRMLARGAVFQVSEKEVELVNAALYLRRPLLITGKPGTGKSSLAYSVAYELNLGPVLRWSITSRSTLGEGLCHYDAIARLRDASIEREATKEHAVSDIGQYIDLGPLGKAFLPSKKPRVLLIDEIDKSDIDLPNDLLNIFEEGEFEIPELRRLAKEKDTFEVYYDKKNNIKIPVRDGYISCHAFPFVILTSNGEREFPPAFLRRCIRLEMQTPNRDKLLKIVEAQLGKDVFPLANKLVEDFIAERDKGYLAVDQLLNAIYLATNLAKSGVDVRSKPDLSEALFRHLSSTGAV